MTASDSIRYRLALSDGFLREARQDCELTRKTHDPGRQIATLIAAGVPPEHLRVALAEIAPDLQALGPAEHVLTDCGDEATETLPWDLFTHDSAAHALALAERVLAQTRRILTLHTPEPR
jgi:hypothetical protein